MRGLTLAPILAGIILALVPTPLSAADVPAAESQEVKIGTATTARPEVLNPLSSSRVTVEVVSEGWGIKRFAREAGRQIDGLRVFTSGTCADRPRTFCVRVVAGSWGEGEADYLSQGQGDFDGLAAFPREGLSVVYLNERHGHSNPYAVAAHEFGHVLGLGHHDALGVDGRTPDVTRLSPAELRVLRSYYGAVS